MLKGRDYYIAFAFQTIPNLDFHRRYFGWRILVNKKISTTRIALFRGKKVRKTIYNDEWWFSVIDIIEALVGTDRPRKYWSDLKNKLVKEGYIEVSEKIGQLKLESPDGKMRKTDCANTETMFRIIQSVPSPKVEPLKRWLAKVAKPFFVIVSLRAWQGVIASPRGVAI